MERLQELANEVIAHSSHFMDDGEQFTTVQSECLDELLNLIQDLTQ